MLKVLAASLILPSTLASASSIIICFALVFCVAGLITLLLLCGEVQIFNLRIDCQNSRRELIKFGLNR